MQTTSPIRRYVLLRQRGHGASAAGWSMERIAPAPHAAGSAAPPTSAKAADAQA